MKEIFFEVFFSLVRLFLNTKDEFFKQKLVKKTKEFWEFAQTDFTIPRDVAKSRYIVQHKNNVAQYSDNPNFLKILDNLNELIEIIIHLKLVSLSPALMAQKNLLHLRSQIMKLSTLEVRTKSAVGKMAVSSGKLPRKKSLYSEGVIVDYLKNQPEGALTGEIINNLQSKLSRRTIQRHLNNLVKSGQIKKTKTGGFSKYNLD